ncbi:hypothetical protein T492DRAFT_892480, partial [Pavlovales sp. CCMP2436]
LVVLSPGPGNPRDFKCSELLAELERRKGAVFGVCLGLQAMVESSSPSMLSHGLPNTFQ